jgi:hypothetical protein
MRKEESYEIAEDYEDVNIESFEIEKSEVIILI